MSSLRPQKIHVSEHAVDPSANDVLKFAEKLSGEDHEVSAPSLGLLQLIVLIRKAEAGNKPGGAWAPLVEHQLRHMKAAVHLINTDPIIAMKFGNPLEGAMSLVGILKARASELDMESKIDGVVASHITPHSVNSLVKETSAFTTRKNAYKAANPGS